jgi:hypothetical protein
LAAALQADQIAWTADARGIAVVWLFAVAPQLIFGFLALSIAPSLRSVVAPTLIALNLALLGYLWLIWRNAPYGEDGFLAGVYILAWIVLLSTAFFFAKGRG